MWTNVKHVGLLLDNNEIACIKHYEREGSCFWSTINDGKVISESVT